jgi:hypothetical protein
VRFAHRLVVSADRTRALADLTVGHAEVLLPVRDAREGGVEFGPPFAVPWGAMVRISPDGSRFLVYSSRDLHTGRYRPNRGAMCAAFADLDWSPGPPTLDHERSGLWYDEPEGRFVPEGDVDLVGVDWREDGVAVTLRRPAGDPETVVLRPCGEWRRLRDAEPALRKLLRCEKMHAAPFGRGLAIALAEDGPHERRIVLVRVAPPAILAEPPLEPGLPLSFGPYADLDGDGRDELVVRRDTRIQSHMNVWVVDSDGDGRFSLLEWPDVWEGLPAVVRDGVRRVPDRYGRRHVGVALRKVVPVEVRGPGVVARSPRRVPPRPVVRLPSDPLTPLAPRRRRSGMVRVRAGRGRRRRAAARRARAVRIVRHAS